MFYNNKNNEEIGSNDFTDSVNIYYTELSRKRHNPLSREEERKLMIEAQNGNITARNKILDSNLRFVFEMAKKYRGKGVDIDELISAGNNGMIRAISLFDTSRDVKFFSYAVWHIRQQMNIAIKKHHDRIIKEQAYDDVFSHEEDDYQNISFNEDYNDNDDNNPKEETYENSFESKEEGEQKNFVVKQLLKQLDTREKTVITMFFGINENEQNYSLEEIGKTLNLSTERVRQIKLKAIDEMRSNVFDIDAANFLFR